MARDHKSRKDVRKDARNDTRKDDDSRDGSVAEERSGNDGAKPIKILAIGVGVLLLVIVAVNIMMGSFNSSNIFSQTTKGSSAGQDLGGSLAPMNNGVQEVTVTMQGNQYLPNPTRLRVGVPVRMTADMSTVRGCYRAIYIPELGVSKTVSANDNVIEFTPTKAGTFRMTCSMGMGQGLVIVEDANGLVPETKTQSAPSPVMMGGSCGGGCGCGGG